MLDDFLEYIEWKDRRGNWVNAEIMLDVIVFAIIAVVVVGALIYSGHLS